MLHSVDQNNQYQLKFQSTFRVSVHSIYVDWNKQFGLSVGNIGGSAG